MKVFIDSDVIISSLISSSGAASILLHQKDITPVISSHSQSELNIVVKRMNLDLDLFGKLVQNRLKIIPLTKKIDAHIVAGAHTAGVKYLITYNLKHFQVEKIKNQLNILTMSPAQFLQYLRSR